jgi:hypothetical protein
MSTITIPQPELSTEDVSADRVRRLARRAERGPPRPGFVTRAGASSPLTSRSTGRGAYARQARTAWTSSAARLSFRSCRIWLTT